MSEKRMDRRQFLKSSGGAAVGLAAVSAGVTIIGPNAAWAISTEVLNADQAQALLIMSRHLFPHDWLGDQYYAKVVEALDAQAQGDDGVRGTLTDGIANLDGAKSIKFTDLSEGNQLQVIEAIEGSDFFNTVHGATVNNLYGNPLVYRHFGFEGSSVEFGGYLERGFDDAGWIPDA